MKTIIFFIGFGGLLAFLFVMVWVICEIGKRNAIRAKEYDDKYDQVEKFIETMRPDAQHYDFIMNELIELSALKWKNKEKTVVLTNKFFIRFGQERLRRVVGC
jgi:hypothetical protein